MRRGLLLVLLVLVLLVLVIGFIWMTGILREDPRPGPVAPISWSEEPVAAQDAGPAPVPSNRPSEEAPSKDSVPEVVTAVEVAVEPVPGPPAGKVEPKPAFRRNPRTPPATRPGRQVGGGRPPMGPTGLWERFPPEIPTGSASIRVRVIDREGVPVAGADVWLGPPSIAGSPAVSFGDLRKAGVTDADGVAIGKNLPDGSAAVAANVGNLLNGPRGLDATSAVRTVLVSGKTVEAEVRLPIALGDYGTIHGVVTGPEDRPLRSASVSCGFNRARTDAKGRFELRFVPVGTVTVTVGRSGYRSFSEQVSIAAGASREQNVQLEYREEGSLHLRGPVVGPDGAAVPDAQVYVIAKSGRGGGTVRSGKSDEHGQFDFPSMPDRLASADVRIQANRRGYRAGNVHFPEGLKQSEIEVRLPVQLTNLRLTVVDASTGAPQTRCRFTARKEDEDRRAASFSSRSPTGIYETWLASGKHTFTIETPDHEPLTAIVEVPPGGADFPYQARLVAHGEESAEIILTIHLVSATTGDPIETAAIEIIGPDEETPVAGLQGERPRGLFKIPVRSGNLKIKVSADGYEPHTESMDLPPTPSEATLELRLSPN